MSWHTPGPWTIGKEPESHSIVNRSFEGDEWCVAEVYNETDMAIANANLIDAAPDLLSVAIQARAAMITIFNDPATSEDAKKLIERKCEYLSAAIARAKGEA